MTRITVVGGGLAGLTAAISTAEAGAEVDLYEGHHTLGGRARSTASPYVANDGPHVFYADGQAWPWLAARGLVSPASGIPLREARRLGFRHRGRIRRTPPVALLRMASHRKVQAPVDEDFGTWATRRFGAEAARLACRALGVVTYEADPGRLSAAFVWERLLRATSPKLRIRYAIGGWQSVVDRMIVRAEGLGVRIHPGERVTALPDRPAIVATTLDAAARLLGDDTLTWESGRTAMLDLGVEQHRADAFAVLDLDEGGFVERYTGPDPSLAPAGESLVQAQMPLRAGESKADGLARLEGLVDLALPGWRHRTTWRRDQVAAGRTGALDLPGTTWRDRPAIERGEAGQPGVFLAGDMVAAPGLLSEVAIGSALRAAELAVPVRPVHDHEDMGSISDRMVS